MAVEWSNLAKIASLAVLAGIVVYFVTQQVVHIPEYVATRPGEAEDDKQTITAISVISAMTFVIALGALILANAHETRMAEFEAKLRDETRRRRTSSQRGGGRRA